MEISSSTIRIFLNRVEQITIEPYSNDLLWIIVVGFILAFIMAFAIGANDVANSFGTSVGSGVLSLKMACILATIFEISGAVLLGDKVSNTIRNRIVDVDIYEGSEKQLTLGYISTLSGCSCWLFTATFFKVPVSTTHSVVAASVGYSLVGRGVKGIKWDALGKIVASWFISPFFSGFISVTIFYIIQFSIMHRKNPLKAGLIALPIIYGLTVFINCFGITKDGPKIFYLHNLPLWIPIVCSLIAGFVTGVIVHLFIVPWIHRKLLQENENLATPPITPENDSPENHQQEADQLFKFLQILTAIFGSFAHGGNDVANAVGPLISLWLIYSRGEVNSEPEQISTLLMLFYGGIGIAVGLWILGRRVIETVGTNLTKITPSTGFTIEIGSACTVLLASKLGMPVSTTHCKVGSVVFVGYLSGKGYKDDDKTESSVNWKLFGSIMFSWVVTVPASIGFSAIIMSILTLTIL